MNVNIEQLETILCPASLAMCIIMIIIGIAYLIKYFTGDKTALSKGLVPIILSIIAIIGILSIMVIIGSVNEMKTITTQTIAIIVGGVISFAIFVGIVAFAVNVKGNREDKRDAWIERERRSDLQAYGMANSDEYYKRQYKFFGKFRN